MYKKLIHFRVHGEKPCLSVLANKYSKAIAFGRRGCVKSIEIDFTS